MATTTRRAAPWTAVVPLRTTSPGHLVTRTELSSPVVPFALEEDGEGEGKGDVVLMLALVRVLLPLTSRKRTSAITLLTLALLLALVRVLAPSPSRKRIARGEEGDEGKDNGVLVVTFLARCPLRPRRRRRGQG